MKALWLHSKFPRSQLSQEDGASCTETRMHWEVIKRLDKQINKFKIRNSFMVRGGGGCEEH